MALSLPYFDADIACKSSGTRVRYELHRTHPAAAPASFVACYAPIGPVYGSQPGCLDYWLKERYCLYTFRKLALLRLDIRHKKWPLQSAGAEIEINTMLPSTSLPPPEGKPLVHFAKRLDVIACLPRRVA